MAWGFNVQQLPPPAVTLPFLVLSVLSLVFTVITLIWVASSRDASHPVLLSLLFLYLIYLIGGSLVAFQQGGHIVHFPPYTICLVQGAMMEASTPSMAGQVAAFNFFLWASIQPFSKGLTKFVQGRVGSFALVLSPWLIWLGIFFFSLSIGIKDKSTVILYELYCVVHLENLSKARLITALIFLVISILLALAISFQVYRTYSSATDQDDRRESMRMLAESWGLGVYVLILGVLLLRARTTQSTIEADMVTVAGGLFILLLGNQVNLFSSTSWSNKLFTLRDALPTPRSLFQRNKRPHSRGGSMSGTSVLFGRTVGRGDSSTTLTRPHEFDDTDPQWDDGSSPGSRKRPSSFGGLSGGKDYDAESVGGARQLSYGGHGHGEVIGMDNLEPMGGAGAGGGKKKPWEKGEKKGGMKIQVETEQISEAAEQGYGEGGKRVYR